MSKHKHHHMADEAIALKVVCPRCAAWIRKPCVHTTGSKVGQETSPHKERVQMAKATLNLSPETKQKIKAVEDAEPVEVKVKTPKDKLSPEQREIADTILDKIYGLQRQAEFVGPVTKGPIVTTFRFKPIHRTKVAHLEAMVKDISVALGSEDLIVVKRMPGESAVGVFVPNKERQIIRMTDTLQNVMAYMPKPTRDGHKKIPLNFGITSTGEPFIDDLTIQPHLLVAGATDSGKSTLMNCLLLSMCWAMSPSELRILVSDPKKVEFKPYYKDLPHLWRPVAGDIYETMALFDMLKRECKVRFDMFGYGEHPVRNVHEYNEKFPDKKLPFIVMLLDELASIMGDQVDRDEAKANASKLGSIVSLARATGIYIIAGAQRTSVNTIKGSIKANFPSRLTFRLPSAADSKTIIDTKGAEQLMARGDMFFRSSARSDLLRLHSPWTELNDLKELVKAIIQREEIERKKAQMKSENDEERLAIQQEGNNQPIERKPN